MQDYHNLIYAEAALICVGGYPSADMRNVVLSLDGRGKSAFTASLHLTSAEAGELAKALLAAADTVIAAEASA